MRDRAPHGRYGPDNPGITRRHFGARRDLRSSYATRKLVTHDCPVIYALSIGPRTDKAPASARLGRAHRGNMRAVKMAVTTTMFYGRLKNAAGDIFSKDNVALCPMGCCRSAAPSPIATAMGTRSLLYKPPSEDVDRMSREAVTM